MALSDPHSFVDLQQSKITHIDFMLTVDFATKTIQGVAAYRLEKPVQGSLFLDTRKLIIKKAHHNGEALKWDIDQEDPIRGQRLHLKQLNNVFEFTIEFVTDVEASALQWLGPEQTSGGRHPFLFSQCQAIQARSMFPCQDTPSVRFTFTAEVIVPEPLIAVMAAAPVSIRAQDGQNHCRFEMPQSIPSYLFALAVGMIAAKDISKRCRIYAEPNILDEAAWEFSETEAKLIEAERLFGPYEWDRYDILVMPPSFPYGGMENPRLTFVTPVVIVGDRSLTDLVTHELAHSWTGNLITNATWEDFWLNEGWTTYAQMRIDEVLDGRDYAQMKSALGREAMMAAMKRFGMDSDLTKLTYPMEGIDPEEVFSTVPYYKGQAFLEAMEQAVGRKEFDAFVSKYIETYKFQSITTEAFLSFLAKELPDAVDAVDINLWLYEPGFPEGAPVIASNLIDEVDASLQAYHQGDRPKVREVRGWNTDQKILFFRRLPKSIPLEDVIDFEDAFNLKQSRNYAVLFLYFALAVRSGYEDILPRVEDFIRTVGRGYHLRPVVQAMVETQWSRPLIKPMIERYRHRHHPLTVRMLEQILEKAGL
ncbi:MAG: M1 family peptidase [Anaerolineales bacterium]|nr:M1 family peptidase [Anaerolineales bacterium]